MPAIAKGRGQVAFFTLFYFASFQPNSFLIGSA